jgi:hypothetical protein
MAARKKSLEHDREAVEGALQKGFTASRIAKAIRISQTSLDAVLAGRGSLSRQQRQALESLTGLTAEELAFDTIVRETDPVKRRRQRNLIAITRQMLRELRPTMRNGHAVSRTVRRTAA